MTGEVLNELRGPTWILDRRNSGKLFWRRDSTSEKNRVKFRCDVEVMEYVKLEPEPPQYEDWSSDEEDDERFGWRLRPWDQEIPPPSGFWGGVCMVVIAAVVTYQWLVV
ncbi:uncharacterized protein LOC128986623 [Macrosteles quadrilineatus]|uniref:uncharacterized protein LOC128986595 n=1 Tax=Macrosteles quadrilineatus TaxID=74068 RepID=UPI0023E0A2C7|nr:uncharacterized protein LOC128986595 [Macrosteles quadrilineatus]XP_054263012.1 uncharacterized protein LOC128986595 [Macrosteles quadrilineatus]XP_054263014.1 uncharacterized protein LOC128986595 [Macrosteles quadrilineatus]XP_054263052.1 uncharacterized protein LOC128986623 [Macrosteles quadrilineatus]XP_054263054.1 uncharacterized protein LOC128986623 [Macrosteles quadrilineatus]XP_054263055.1 uncharacterized protein LOC128986623 [Macrosteles quadrilineatus]